MTEAQIDGGALSNERAQVAATLESKTSYITQLLEKYHAGEVDNSELAGLLADHMAVWQVHWKVEKFNGDWNGEQIASGEAGDAYEVLEGIQNLLMYGGASNLWQCLIGNGTGTGSQTLTYFNNGNAYIGVGDSNTAAAATQTDLQASTNKLRKAMDSTYPQHTDATTSGAASIIFRSTFASGDANYAWAEWAIFNGSTGGRMLNRKVEALGTKASGTSWQLTVTLTLS